MGSKYFYINYYILCVFIYLNFDLLISGGCRLVSISVTNMFNFVKGNLVNYLINILLIYTIKIYIYDLSTFLNMLIKLYGRIFKYITDRHMNTYAQIPYFRPLFMIAVKFLEFIKPFCAVLPEIAKPERKVSIIYITLFV